VEQVDNHKCNHDILTDASDPNKTSVYNSDDATVIKLNRSGARNIASALRQGVPKVLAFADTHAIADTGATSIFVMAGTPMKNIHATMDPLTINLPNGKIVHSTHICDINSRVSQ
jgi:hypothetical protein